MIDIDFVISGTKICPMCGIEFKAENTRTVYCTDDCRIRYYNNVLRKRRPRKRTEAQVYQHLEKNTTVSEWFKPHICLWHLRGDTDLQIARTIHRPVAYIRKILSDPLYVAQAQRMKAR